MHPAVATEYEQTPCLWFSGLLPQPADLPEKLPLVMNGITLSAEVEGWYAWRCANWGTKWEPSYSTMRDSTDECYLEIDFDTAWSPPTPFFQALADKFPTADITLLCYEGGCDFSGVDHWHNGVFTQTCPAPGQTHAEFLESHRWYVASFDEDEDYDDQDRDYELDGEDYEGDDYDGDDMPIGEGGLTFEELAGDDEEEEEEGEEAPEPVKLFMGSSIPPVTDWTDTWRDA